MLQKSRILSKSDILNNRKIFAFAIWMVLGGKMTSFRQIPYSTYLSPNTVINKQDEIESNEMWLFVFKIQLVKETKTSDSFTISFFTILFAFWLLNMLLH